MHTVAIIQARLGSTRLPGKILADLGGMPILAWVVRAARAASLVDHVVVATTTSPEDEATVRLCAELGVDVIRGPEDDVLTRFMQALRAHPADLVVRLTADCPLLDPGLIDATVALASSPAAPDYASTTLVRTLPRGLDVEVVRASSLVRVDREATGYHRTHVTSHIYTHPDRYACLGLDTLHDASGFRLTVDTSADLEVVRGVVGYIGSGVPSATSAVAALRGIPQLAAANSHVRQKPLDEA